MSDLERVTRAKIERDDSAYKKGVREGFDQALWFLVGLAIFIYWLAQWFP